MSKKMSFTDFVKVYDAYAVYMAMDEKQKPVTTVTNPTPDASASTPDSANTSANTPDVTNASAPDVTLGTIMETLSDLTKRVESIQTPAPANPTEPPLTVDDVISKLF